MARLCSAQKYVLRSDPGIGATAQRLAGIGVSVKLGEIAGGDVNADAVTFLKHIRRTCQFDIVFIDLAGGQ